MKHVSLSEFANRGVEVNMSPLIDCVFLLLIFFIVTTVFVDEAAVEVKKPRAASAQDLEKHSIMLTLTAQGDIVYGDRRLSLSSVRGLVSRQLRGQQRPVIILADQDTRTARLVDLIDECKLAGAKNVSIAATQES